MRSAERIVLKRCAMTSAVRSRSSSSSARWSRASVSLSMLAVASCLLTALFEAGWIWAYHGYEPSGTLGNNFTLVLGLSPAWQLLVCGLVIALAAAVRPSTPPG